MELKISDEDIKNLYNYYVDKYHFYKLNPQFSHSEEDVSTSFEAIIILEYLFEKSNLIE